MTVKLTFGLLFDALSNSAWRRACLIVIIAACLVPIAAHGQQGSETTNASITSDDDLAKYDQLINQIYGNVEDTYAASMQFYVNGLEESYDWKDKWREGKEKTGRALADFRATACRVYGSDSPQPESLGSIIGAITKDMYASNQLQDLHFAYEKMIAANSY